MPIAEFITIATIHLLAVMSPGPDFLLVSHHSLSYSRKTAVYSALGLALGILVHVTYSLVGIGFLVSQSIVLFSIIKFAGAGYLMYIGYKSLQTKQSTETTQIKQTSQYITPSQAIRTGFITNVLNPKATLFFLALFTQVVDKDTPKLIQAAYGLEMSAMTFVWFGLVATVLSHRLLKVKFVRVQHKLENIFGVLLIALGVKVALSKN